MPAWGVNRRFAFTSALALGCIWFWIALDRTYNLPNQISWHIYANRPLSESATELVDLFDFPPFESEAIQRICGETKWNESLVFTCDGPVGGVGNIRNSILNCVRYAISAGASLVVPRIVLRNPSDISHIRTGKTTDMSYMFDTQHFYDSMRLSCPSLTIHESREDIKDFENAHDAISLLPESLVDDIPGTGLPNPSAWRETFYKWLMEHSDSNFTGPYIVDLERSYLQYPIYSDGEDFAISFGNVLKFRTDVRLLATKTLKNLAKSYSLNVDLTQRTLPNASFFGAHLRTEKDARDAWPGDGFVYSRYETQSRLYLEQAAQSNPAVIYVASGNLSEIGRFSIDASNSPQHLNVTQKFDLLSTEDVAELEAMAWDQQGLVDFMVMLKASDFAGIAHSSFAWSVALKRHIFAENRNHLDGPQMLSDELSQIYGIPHEYPEYAACLWP